jgi:hypothetical protein
VVHLLGTRRDERKALLKSESDAVIEAHNSPDTYNLLAGNATLEAIECPSRGSLEAQKARNGSWN